MRATGLFGGRDYRLWWAGSLVSGVGSAMTLVAYPLLILAITGSPFQAGLVGALEAVPFAALSLPAGVLADRLPRRRLLAGSSLASVLATGWIPVGYAIGVLDVQQIYVTAVVNGAAGVIFLVTQVAVIPQLVREPQLGAAAGQAEVIFNTSAVVGPPLAGVLLAAWLALPMLADALSFAAMGCVVFAIRARLDPAPPPLSQAAGQHEARAPGAISATRPGWRADLAAGIRTVFADRQLRSMTVITIVGDMMFAGIAVLMTVLLRYSGASPQVVGLNFSLAAVGGVAGSLLAGRVERRFGLFSSILARSWATAALFPVLALHVLPVVLGLTWCAINVMIAVMNVLQMRYLMIQMPNELLGRVQSVLTFLSYAVLPLGALVTGALLSSLGPAPTVLCFTGVFVVLAGFATISPGLRAERVPG